MDAMGTAAQTMPFFDFFSFFSLRFSFNDFSAFFFSSFWVSRDFDMGISFPMTGSLQDEPEASP
jgi:hypothetical protein